MESRTTPSLSFSMPGRMSTTVSGRRGGGQIWLTVRCTGCFFFFHRVRSFRDFPGSGILGPLGSDPGCKAHRVLCCLRTPAPSERALRAAPRGPRGASRSKAGSGAERAHLRSLRGTLKPCQFLRVIWAPRCRLREGRVSRLPLSERWTVPSPWRQDANSSGTSGFLSRNS